MSEDSERKKRMKEHCILTVFGAGVCMAVALLLGGCGRQEAEEPIVVVEGEQKETVYELATVVIGDIQKTQRVNCTYRQLKEQEISFGVSGRVVEKVYVQEGSAVKAGDLLAQLSDGSLEQDIARLEYNIARNELLLSYIETDEAYDISGQWVQFLYYSGQTESDEERLSTAIESIQKNYRYLREDYNDDLEIDRMELNDLRQKLEQNRVYAGINGMVYQVKEGLEGSTSKAGETIITLIDDSQCVFETSVPQYAYCFHEGESISMKINSISLAGDYELVPWNMEEWGEQQFFVIMDGADSVNIEVGTTGTMVVVTDNREQVLCVPIQAVHKADGKDYVYVLGQDNMRQVRWIETGLHGDTLVEVTEGLLSGERVIVQ